jgi:hypothetical protein
MNTAHSSASTSIQQNCTAKTPFVQRNVEDLEKLTSSSRAARYTLALTKVYHPCCSALATNTATGIREQQAKEAWLSSRDRSPLAGAQNHRDSRRPISPSEQVAQPNRRSDWCPSIHLPTSHPRHPLCSSCLEPGSKPDSLPLRAGATMEPQGPRSQV